MRTPSARAISIVTFTALTEAQWSAIWKTIRSIDREEWPDGIEAEARRDIEGFGRAVWEMRRTRSQLGPPAKLLKSVRGLLKQTHKLQRALKASLPDRLLALGPEHGQPLEGLDQWLQALLVIYESLAGPEFSRRSDFYRVWLYEALLEYWAESLGGKLSFSRAQPANRPYGHLIEFLTLTVSAIFSEAPGPSRMAKIIDQYRRATQS
jgi:hypothetical protein